MPKKRKTRGPKWVALIGPVFAAVRELGGSARPPEVYEHVSASLRLGEAQRSATTPGGAPQLKVHIQFAKFFLVRDGYLEGTKRGVWALTGKGRRTKRIAEAQALEMFLRIQAGFDSRSVRSKGGASRAVRASEPVLADSSEDALTSGHRVQVLQLLRELSPAGFERFCQRLLREVGFQRVEVRGRSGDGGIDGVGVLQINRLVSFPVAFQCKRYSGSVQAKELREFRGSIAPGSTKGIFVTTGGFTTGAMDAAALKGAEPIDLVDGEQLVNMLEELEIGLVPAKTYRVDGNFFATFRDDDARGKP